MSIKPFLRNFSVLSVDKVQALQNRSASALNVFEKTKTELASINEAIMVEETTRQAEIVRLQAEVNSLTAQRSANGRIITKLQNFLND